MPRWGTLWPNSRTFTRSSPRESESPPCAHWRSSAVSLFEFSLSPSLSLSLSLSFSPSLSLCLSLFLALERTLDNVFLVVSTANATIEARGRSTNGFLPSLLPTHRPEPPSPNDLPYLRLSVPTLALIPLWHPPARKYKREYREISLAIYVYIYTRPFYLWILLIAQRYPGGGWESRMNKN